MKKILIAEAAPAIPVMSGILEKCFELVYCNEVDEALARFDQDIGLIIAGCHFGNNQMAELLHRAKSLPQIAAIPFLCVRLIDDHDTDNRHESVQQRALSQGADGFIDFLRWERALGMEYAAAKLRVCVDHFALDRETLKRRNSVLSGRADFLEKEKSAFAARHSAVTLDRSLIF